MAQKPDNRANLFRLQIIIIDGGLLVLRNIIDQTLTTQGITLSACLNNEKTTISRLKSRGIITQVQYDILFPTGGQAPTTSEMDFTLITCLLRCLKSFGLNKKFDWTIKPISTDLTVEADIYRLKAYRNEICHLPTTTDIQPNDFVTWWNDIEQILVRRSSQTLNIHQAIADFKTCPLDPEEEKRLQKGVEKNMKEVEAKVSGVEKDMKEVDAKFTGVEKNMKDVEAKVSGVEKEVKEVEAKFTGVEKDMKEVEAKVTGVEKDMKEVEAKFIGVEKDMKEVEAKFTGVEGKLEAMEKRQDAEKSNECVSPIQTEEEKYQTRKKELQDALFEFYKTRHSKVFLSPLFEEKDTPLASFYIRPEVNAVVSTQTGNDEKVAVKSLSQMFKTDDMKNREIYVLAEVGLGKTAFSKYLANVWYQAHNPNVNMNEFLSEDLICMQEFDFLFLVPLRDSADLCSIDDLIFEKIVSNLGLEEKISEDVLLKILKNEKCLIILDGLDEWTHPDKKCNRSPLSIPHRNDREKCTILTTTRPWKLGVLDLNSCQLGKKVELTKLSNDSAVTLIRRIFQRLKSHQNRDLLDIDVRHFIQTIEMRKKTQIAYVPLFLIYTICLWCDGIQIGDSKCDLYINIVELLLSRTIQVHGDLQKSWEPSSSDIPECFAIFDNCKKYFPLLMHVGKLAYHTLSNETKENTLVFYGSVARKYLTPDEMEFILHSGILSESTSKTLTKKFSKVSFSHKTVQEFFAAIFISFHSDAQKTVLENCRDVQDILDMSIICELISEMNAGRMCAISNDLMSVINGDQETRDYRITWTPSEDHFDIIMYSTQLYNIQNMFMSCLQEMPDSENIQLCLQDFFIDKDTVESQQLQRLLKQNKTNIKSLYIDIRYVFSSLSEIIDLFALTDLSHIQKLSYHANIRHLMENSFHRYNIIEYKQEEYEINRILFSSLQNVTLKHGKWTKDEENLSETLSRVQNLQYLYIRDCMLSNKKLETIMNFISRQKSMKVLTLRHLYCECKCREHGYSHFGCDDCERLNLDVSKHSTLSKLDLASLPRRLELNISTPSLVYVSLWDINLDECLLKLSRDMVNIERVELKRIKMSAGRLQNFITVLENLPQSVTVEMKDIEPETEYKCVRENIRSSQTFHVIHDSDIFVFETVKPIENRQKQKHCEII